MRNSSSRASSCDLALALVGLDRLEHGQNILLHGEPSEDRGLLRQVADAKPGPAIHRQLGHVPAVDRDGALVGGDQSRNHVEHGGLAGAVRPQQPDGLAAAQIETDAADDGALLEALDHGANGEQADGGLGLGPWRMVERFRGDRARLCGDCLATWERQQFAHYPFRSLEVKRRPVNIS